MSSPTDRARFLSEPTRLKVAILCRDEALTRAEIAAKLGRDAGSLSQPRTMAKRKALEMRARRKGSDGRGSNTYRLARSWRPALDEAQALSGPAWPVPGQDLLVIPLDEVERACAVLAAGVPGVSWGARVSGARGGLGGLVLAPVADRDGASMIRLMARLGGSVPGIARLQFDEVLAEADLQSWSARVSGRAPQLPPQS